MKSWKVIGPSPWMRSMTASLSARFSEDEANSVTPDSVTPDMVSLSGGRFAGRVGPNRCVKLCRKFNICTESNQLDERAIRDEAFYLVAKLVGRSDPSRLEAWAGLGLTITQLRVLFMLRAEAGLAAGSLAAKLGVTPSTLTRIVDRRARNELVRRDAGEDDRRLVRHWLTASGLAVVEEMERTGRERMDR